MVPPTPSCIFCNKKDDETNLGELKSCNNITAHYFCILLTTKLVQNGEDSEGIYGFLEKDILRAFENCSNKICSYCGLKNANIVCAKFCGIKYHLPCGLKNGVLCKFFGKYPSYCKDCRSPLKKIDFFNFIKTCAICSSTIEEDVYNVYHPECCKPKSLLHMECVKNLAMHSGYYTKCLFCNNKGKFRMSLRRNGVFIPDQDATWANDTGSQTRFCSALECICPSGKDFEDRVWKLEACSLCGDSLTHTNCFTSENSVCVYCEDHLEDRFDLNEEEENEIDERDFIRCMKIVPKELGPPYFIIKEEWVLHPGIEDYNEIKQLERKQF